MKSHHLRAGVGASLFGIIVALLILAFPTSTNAAPLVPQPTDAVQLALGDMRGQNESAPAMNMQGGFCTVTVQRGEALYMIAARYHTSTAYIAALNNLYNANYIYAGMVLKVPCVQPPYPQPRPYPYPNKYPICTYYIVRPGDWLKTIAAYYGVS